ncbi:hypothetical protein [Mucilaginibacter celer]|uniref:Glycosyltransferase n=1 Tax=Mucilaginibacter celer TaxID=2305508 RepID=A0A494VP66_9SPHI|nr:hypothetical protein [Mucilaginibacter celer]AYL97246.1 hypothetical protein HYN43_018870 [Mucilaginibacter celer]
MNNILIISNRLGIGGAEKLLLELVFFAQKNNINPTVLILDSYEHEHYDGILKAKGVKVVRTRINTIKHFRAPVKMIRSAWWAVKLKYLAAKYYKSIHTIGLYNVDKVFNTVPHPHRFFWNVNNAIQYPNREYAYQQELFGDSNDTIININKYQETELRQQYKDAIKAKMVLAKLFINAPG